MTTSPPENEKPAWLGYPIHYYSSLMGEAVNWIVHANRILGDELVESGDDPWLAAECGTFARYAFLVSCNAAESGANSLLGGTTGVHEKLFSDLERLSTLNKYEVFCQLNGHTLPRDNHRYGLMKEVITCRNLFVHPRRSRLDAADGEFRIVGGRQYPKGFDHFVPQHAIDMIRDTLGFIAWVVFDVCGFDLASGYQALNGEIFEWTGEIYSAEHELNYDIRSLGIVRERVDGNEIVYRRANGSSGTVIVVPGPVYEPGT